MANGDTPPELTTEDIVEWGEHFISALDEVVEASLAYAKSNYVSRHRSVPEVSFHAPFFTTSEWRDWSKSYVEKKKSAPSDYSSIFRGTGMLITPSFEDPVKWPKVHELCSYCLGKPRLALFYSVQKDPKGQFVSHGIDGILADAADRYIHLTGQSETFNQDVAINLFTPIAKTLSASELDVDIVVPIAAVSFPFKSLKLDDTALIVPMTRSLASALFRIYQYRQTVPKQLHTMASHCLVLKKWHFKNAFYKRDDFIGIGETFPTEEIDQAFAALRLVVDAPLGYSLLVYRTRSWTVNYDYVHPTIFGRTTRSYPSALDSLAHYEHRAITKEEAAAVKALYPQIKIRTEDRFRLAVRRLNRCLTRDDDEDSLIDAVIGLEALFGDGHPGDITYKLAVRAAAVLSLAGKPWDETLSAMKKVYGARSGIVHGGHKRQNETKRLNAEETGKSAVTQYAIEALRCAIKVIAAHPSFLSPQKIDRELLHARPLNAK